MKKLVKFTDGTSVATSLSKDQIEERVARLNCLSTLLEELEDDVAKSIVDKIGVAFAKEDDFTGVIRLTKSEKSFLASLTVGEQEAEVISFYTANK